MEINTFISNFADQFDETNPDVFVPELNFRSLEEWSSLNALAIMNMIGKKYGVKLLPNEMKQANTIQELYDIVLTRIQ